MRRCLLVLILGVGCHHSHPVQAPTTTAQVPPAQPAAATEKSTPASPNVAVSDDLAKQCTLEVGNTQDAPKFDYNETDLLPQDRDVLEKVATCVTSGPLKGRQLKLVGRADPRGTEEYNLGLGTRRASQVKDFLVRLGVHNTQLAETTRGALDAKGRDEDGWRLDRRVDVQLVR